MNFRKVFLILSLLVLNNFVYSQLSCPMVDKRNNGNGQWSSAPGDFRPTYNQNNAVSANFVGTAFQIVKVNPNTKSGELTMKWDNLDVTKTPAITKVFHTDATGKTTQLSTVFGPAAPTKAGEDKAIFCFYGANLPNAGTLSLEFTDVKTASPLYYCSFDLKEFKSVNNPTISLAFPKINTQPISWSVLGDGSTTLSVDASDVKSYKWQYSSNGTTWNDVSGDFTSNNNTLQISNRGKYNNYSFRVVLTNIYGTTISNAATLTVDQLPTIAFDGVTKVCNVNSLTGVKVNLTGIAPWSISYKVNNGNTTTVSDINTSTYTIPVQSATDLTLTLVSVSDKKYTNNSISSNTFNGYVTPSVSVSNVVGFENETALNLSFTTTGNPDKYTLSSIGPGISELGTVTNDVNTSILTTQPLSVGSYNYSISASNSVSGCVSTSKTFSITVSEKPISFVNQPSSATYLADGIARFGVSSLNAKNTEWQLLVGSNWTKLQTTGDYIVSKDSLIIQNRKNHNGESYRVVISNNSSNLTSSVATLTIDQLPTIAFDGITKVCNVESLTGVKVNLTGIAPWSITYEENNIQKTINDINTTNFSIPLNVNQDLVLKLISVSDKKYTNSTIDNNTFTGFVAPTINVSNISAKENDTVLNLKFTYTGTPDKYIISNTNGGIVNFDNATKTITDTVISNLNLVYGKYDYSIQLVDNKSGCTSVSKTFTITVEDNPVLILNQPKDTTFFLVGDGNATIFIPSKNAKVVVWEKSTDNGVTWTTVSGNDYLPYKDSLVVLNRNSHSNEYFRVTYSNSISTVTSNKTLLYIEKFPTAYFKNTVHCDVNILKAIPVIFEGTPPFELVYQVEGVPGEEAHFVPNIKTNTYNIIVGGLTKQTNIKLLRVNNKRYVNNNLTNVPIFTSYKKNTIKTFVDTLIDEENQLIFKTTGDAYKTFNVDNGTTKFPNFTGINGEVIKDSSIVFNLPNDGSTPGKYNFIITMNNENNTCYNKATIYVTAIQNKLLILTQPVSQSYLENGSATFALKSQYSTSYVWQYTFNDGVTWNDIKQGGNFTKVTKDTLIVANRLFYKNNKFRIVLYGKYENVTSNTVTLSVERKPIAFFETTKKCYTGKTKSALVYFKGVAPFKISYVNENGVVNTISNITKDVYTLPVDSVSNKLRLLTVSDSRFTDVALDSSNTISFLTKPVYRPYFKSACFKDSLVELLFSGSSQPATMTLKTGVNPIPGFAVMSDVPFVKGYKLTLPKNLALGTYGFIVTGNDGNCTSDEVKINLSMNAIPVMTASADKININQGDSVELVATGADVVRWSPVSGISNATAKTVVAKPESTTIYTSFGYQNGCVGQDTIKITVNSTPKVSNCQPIVLNVLSQDIKNATCNNADGQVTFTVSGGSENNKYRVRKKNDNGTFTILTNPAFAPINNQVDESKVLSVTNLVVGNYDIFAFCGTDSRVSKVFNFAITSPCDTVKVVDTTKNTPTPTTNYTCKDMVLTIDNADVKPITCDYDFGSVTFSIQGGAPNFTYRLRKRNQDNTFTIVTNPVFVSIGNKANEAKKITIDQLTEGEYELYVYCSQDVSFYKSLSFYIYKQGCRSLLDNVISYYSFDKNNADSLKRASDPVIVGAVKDFDNYGTANAAFKIYNATDNLTFKNFVDIDTMKEYSISFWYKLLEMPKYNSSTLLTVPNGTQTQRFEIVADKNGYLKVQFGKTETSSTVNTRYKFEPSTWNQLVLTHRQDSNIVFVNDVQVAAFKAGNFIDNNTDFVVGYDGKNKSLRFLFDEFKLYGKAISAQDVKDNYFADVRENCTGIRLNIEVDGSKLKFVVAYGSTNNKYRLRKKNSSGVFVSVYDQTFISIYNKLGESKVINTENLTPGIYDVYAYCGSDAKKYQGYEFIVDNNGNTSIYRKITPTETIEISTENAKEVKEEIFLNVYPNPVDNVINIDIVGADPSIQKDIKLISSNGTLVHSESFIGSDNSSTINVENFRAGVYILEVHLEDNRVERKQIVIN